MWWDGDLVAGQRWDDVIRARVEESAVFLALLSHGYGESEYCQLELDAFRAVVGDGGSSDRLFTVLINDLPPEDLPGGLSEIQAAKLFEPDIGTPLPLDPKDKVFRKQFHALTDALFEAIEAVRGAPGSLRTAVGEEDPGVERSSSDAATIFVADVADSLARKKARIVNALEEAGHRVVTDVPPPYEAGEHRQGVIEVVCEADLSVHLFDELAGRAIGSQEDTESYPQAQMRLCSDHGVAQFAWLAPSVDIGGLEDALHSGFLRQLEGGAPPTDHDASVEAAMYEFARGPAADVPTDISAMIDRVRRRASVDAARGSGSVLLDTHFKDVSKAFDVGREIENMGFELVLNPAQDDPGQVTGELAARLADVGKLILLFGEVSPHWVRERLFAALKLILDRRYAVQAFGIYMPPDRISTAGLDLPAGLLNVETLGDRDSLRRFLGGGSPA